MKKVYLIGALLMVGSSTIAQSNFQAYTFGVKEKMVNYNSSVQDNPANNKRNVESGDRDLNIVWSEDFTGSTGLVTANGTWTTEGPDASYWSIDGGSTAPNGYALSMNGDHLLWNSYDPIVNVEPNFATTPVDGSIITPTI